MLRTVLSVLVLRLFSALTGILLTIAISRVGGAATLGAYGFVISGLAIVSVPLSYGWATMVLKSAAIAKTAADWGALRTMVRSVYALAIPIALFTFAAASIYAGRAQAQPEDMVGAIAFFAVASYFDQLSNNRLALIRAFGFAKVASFADAAARASIMLVLIGVLVFGRDTPLGIFELAAFYFIASLSNWAFGQIFVSRYAPANFTEAASTPFRAEWFGKALAFGGSAGLIVLNGAVDTLILGLNGDLTDLGRYRVALQFGLLTAFAANAINFVVTPKLASGNDVVSEVVMLTRLAFVTSLAMPAGLLLFGPTVIPLIFGAEFAGAWIPATILSSAQAVGIAFGFNAAFLAMNNLVGSVIRVTSICLAINILGCVLLIPTFGSTGAAISAGGSLIAWNLGLWFKTWRGLDTNISIFGSWREIRSSQSP